MMSLQSIIWVFLLNNFSCVINLLLTKIARARTERISAFGLFCSDFAALGPYCQDLRPIFSQYGPRPCLRRLERVFRCMRTQSTHAITKMHAPAESVLKSAHRKLISCCVKSCEPEIKSAENIILYLHVARKFAR